MIRNKLEGIFISVLMLCVQGGLTQTKEAFNVLILHDQALVEAANYPDKYQKKIDLIDSLSLFLKGDKKQFVSDMVSSMQYVLEGKLDSALSLCYMQFYNERKLDENDLIVLHRQIAAIYRSLGDHVVSKGHIYKALRIAERLGYETQTISTDLAFDFMELGQLDSVKYYLFNSLKTTADSFGVYMNLATIYSEIEGADNLDSAYHYANEAYKLDTDKNCNTDLTYIYMVFGKVEKSWGNYDSSIYFFKEIVQKGADYMDWYPYTEANVQLVEIYAELGMFDSASFYMDNFFLCPCLDHEVKAHLNEVKSNYYLKVGDQIKAQKFQNESVQHKDSLILTFKQDIEALSALNVSQFSILEENLDIKNKNLKATQSKNIAYFISVLLLAFLMGLIFVFFMYKLKKKKELLRVTSVLTANKIEFLKLNEEKMKSDLQNKNMDLERLATNLALKKGFITDHIQKLKEMGKMDFDEFKPFLKKYLTELNAVESVDNNINSLQGDIQKINSKLMSNLKNQFPAFTENDVQICVLHLLKLSTKEIAALRGVTPKSIQVARYRIKKKMNLERDEDIVPFIEENMLN